MKRLWILKIVFPLLLAFSTCYSEPDDKNKIDEIKLFMRNDDSFDSKEEINKFTNALLKDKVALDKTWKIIRISCSAVLGELGYGTGPFEWNYGEKEKSAIKSFQNDLNIPNSGILDSLTLLHLYFASKGIEQNKITLPDKFFISMEGYIFARGTWLGLDFDLAHPINSIDIACNKQTKSINIVTTNFITDALDLIDINRDFYDIIKWDETTIIGEAKYDCRKSVITVNIPTEEITLNSYSLNTCKDLGNETRTMKLVSGSTYSQNKDNAQFIKKYNNVYKYKNKYEELKKKNMRDLEYLSK